MKTGFPFIVLILISVVFFNCDKVDEPFPNEGPDVIDTIADSSIIWDDSVFSASNNGERYVLMEEFTGHTCTNCPTAASEIERIKDKFYGNKFIAISIHATEQFGAPEAPPGAPDGSYETDHRKKPESTDYEGEDYFKVLAGLPRGMVSRSKEGNVYTKWKQDADQIFNNPGTTVANLHIANYYDDSSGIFKTRVSVEWLVAHNSELNLQIQMVEDNITDWQLDNGVHDEFYNHKHMFRGSVNSSFGEAMPPANVGDTTVVEYNRLFDPDGIGIKKEDFIIVAFLYKKKPEWEVMQVNEAHLIN